METRRRVSNLCRAALVYVTAASVLMASEYRGAVKSGTLPVPGVTVSAVQGEKKFTTTTDQDGTFRFADLPDGMWNIDVEMIGFAKVTRPVELQPGTPVSSWDLKLLTQEELLASLRPKAPPSDSALSPQGLSATTANSSGGKAPPSDVPQRPFPPGTFPPGGFPAGGFPGGPVPTGGTQPPGVAGGGLPPPSSTASAVSQSKKNSQARSNQPGQPPAGFQRLDVNQSATAGGFGDLGGLRNEDLADLNQSAANSLSVQGSMSAAAGLAPQGD